MGSPVDSLVRVLQGRPWPSKQRPLKPAHRNDLYEAVSQPQDSYLWTHSRRLWGQKGARTLFAPKGSELLASLVSNPSLHSEHWLKAGKQ